MFLFYEQEIQSTPRCLLLYHAEYPHARAFLIRNGDFADTGRVRRSARFAVTYSHWLIPDSVYVTRFLHGTVGMHHQNTVRCNDLIGWLVICPFSLGPRLGRADLHVFTAWAHRGSSLADVEPRIVTDSKRDTVHSTPHSFNGKHIPSVVPLVRYEDWIVGMMQSFTRNFRGPERGSSPVSHFTTRVRCFEVLIPWSGCSLAVTLN